MLLFAVFVATVSRGQQVAVTGQVLDTLGEPVPFALVYPRSLPSAGVSANSEGQFRMLLSLDRKELVVRSVGYKEKIVHWKGPEEKVLNIVLEPEPYELEEVVIGGGEDPAYAIIRHAIAHRRTHRNESRPYSAKVYIKGLQRILEAPSRILGMEVQVQGLDSNRSGILYLSESESRIRVYPPNQFHEEMISSKVSGNSHAFSLNRASELQLSFYENHQAIFEGLSHRPFISPIGDQALRFYRYRWLGTTEGAGRTLHKIQVIPRRKGDPLYQGEIYIVDLSWCLYSLNLLITKDYGARIVDSLAIRQELIPIEAHQWQPSHTQVDFSGGLLGIRIQGYYAAVYGDYRLDPPPDSSSGREVFRVKQGVGEKDSAYWAQVRPLPLTEEERMDYVVKDSLHRRLHSREYMDSLDRVHHRISPLNLLLGYAYRNSFRRWNLRLDAPLTSVNYHSVEGLVAQYGMTYRRRVDTFRNQDFSAFAQWRYGFGNQRFHAFGGLSFPRGRSQWKAYGGSQMIDLNSRGSLLPLVNSFTTTVLGHNYLKLYECQAAGLEGEYRFESNFSFKAGLHWEKRTGHSNAHMFTFRQEAQGNIRSQNPFSPRVGLPVFPDHQALKITLEWIYDFGREYESYPQGRKYLPSPWPSLSLVYIKGLPQVLGSAIDYDFLAVNLNQSSIRLGIYGYLDWELGAGTFMGRGRLYYPDYHHFRGRRTWIGLSSLSTFLLLDYYTPATSTRFIEGHGEYNLSTLVTGRIPWLRDLRLSEILGVHFLHTPELGTYAEGHGGLEWQFVRIVYARCLGTPPGPGSSHALRLSFNLF